MPFTRITSLSNERIKAAAKLRRRKHRGRQGRTLVDGARELLRALETKVEVAEIYFCPNFCQTPESRRLLERLDELPTSVHEVTPEVFEKLAYGQRCDGFVAVARPRNLKLCDLRLPENPLVVVLEAVEKPGNLGAVIRSADGAGAAAVIIADQQTDIYNPNSIRASLGTVFSMQVCAASTEKVLAWLREQKLALFAARVDADLSYTQADLAQPTAVILGAEATGLSDAWTADDITPIQIPMLGVADSLNVSSTAAVLCYEGLRQSLPSATSAAVTPPV